MAAAAAAFVVANIVGMKRRDDNELHCIRIYQGECKLFRFNTSLYKVDMLYRSSALACFHDPTRAHTYTPTHTLFIDYAV